MAANLPKTKDPNERFAIIAARHNGHVENDAFKEFVDDRKQWQQFVKKNGLLLSEIERQEGDTEPPISEAEQANLDEQAAQIQAEIERAGRPVYPGVDADLADLEARQQAAATAEAKAPATKPQVSRPSPVTKLARSIKGSGSVRTPQGRVGTAIALFLVLLLVVVMVGGIMVSNGNGGSISTTRWKLAGAVLSQKAVIA